MTTTVSFTDALAFLRGIATPGAQFIAFAPDRTVYPVYTVWPDDDGDDGDATPGIAGSWGYRPGGADPSQAEWDYMLACAATVRAAAESVSDDEARGAGFALSPLEEWDTLVVFPDDQEPSALVGA